MNHGPIKVQDPLTGKVRELSSTELMGLLEKGVFIAPENIIHNDDARTT